MSIYRELFSLEHTVLEKILKDFYTNRFPCSNINDVYLDCGKASFMLVGHDKRILLEVWDDILWYSNFEYKSGFISREEEKQNIAYFKTIIRKLKIDNVL
jgi:hypothetical protein